MHYTVCIIFDSSILVSLWRDSATRYMSQVELWPKHRTGLLHHSTGCHIPVMLQITYRTHTIAQPEFNTDGQLLARPNLAWYSMFALALHGLNDILRNKTIYIQGYSIELLLLLL